MQKHGTAANRIAESNARNQQRISDKAADAAVKREELKSREVIKTQEAAAAAQARLQNQKNRQAQTMAAQEARRQAALEESKQKAVYRIAASNQAQVQKAAREVFKTRATQAKLEQDLVARQAKAEESAAQLRERGARASMKDREKLASQIKKDKEAVLQAQEKTAQAALKTQQAEQKLQQSQSASAAAEERLAAARTASAAAANRLKTSEEQLASASMRTAQARVRFAEFFAKRNRAKEEPGAEVAQKTSLLSNLFGKATGATQAFGNGLSSLGGKLLSAGKNMQWVGRILETRITLPMALLGAFGLRAAFDLDKAMTRVRKVYDNTANDGSTLRQQTDELQRSFFALSDIFGVQVEKVAEIGAAWAAAGASGTTLQRAVRSTIEAQIIGDLDTDTAIKGLISLVNVYDLSVKSIDENGKLIKNSLTEALATFNAVENATAIQFPDLIEVLNKSGGVAREAGVDLRHLAAMAASLVPAAGNASEAGTALKSVLFQLTAPPKDAADAMRSLGLNIDSVSWASLTATERLDEIQKKIKDLPQAQRLNFGRDLGQRQQGSRLLVLLRDMAKEQGNYAKALEATASSDQILASFNRELGEVLLSQGQRFDILTNRARNYLIRALIPMMPIVNFVLLKLVNLTQAIGNFAKAHPNITKLALAFAGFLFVLGPLLSYLGTLKILLGGGLAVVGKLITGIGALVAWIGVVPVVIAAVVAALGLLAYTFRDKLGKALAAARGALANIFAPLMPLITAVMSGVNRIVVLGLSFLPKSFYNAFNRVVEVVKSAALAVYSWLSWMNPFARHSPSLVDQVRAGTKVIQEAYRQTAGSVVDSMGRVGAALRALSGDLARVQRETDALQLKEILESASLTGVDLGLVRELVGGLHDMQANYRQLGQEIKAQELANQAWEDQLKAADKEIDAAKKSLEGLQGALEAIDKELEASKDRLSQWLQTPVAGTYAFEDAIFSNQQAQKSLQLQIAQLEKQVLDAGFAIDDVRSFMDEQAKSADGLADSLTGTAMSADDAKSRMAQLRSEIEVLRGESLDLRLMGAGSDVLGGIEQQISQAEAARRELAKIAGSGATGGAAPPQSVQDAVRQIDALQKQLDKLGKDGEILDLEKALALEPAQKAIQDTQRIAEKSFDEILAGISRETAATAELTSKRTAAAKAVEDQQAVIDGLTLSRDALQASYDAEIAKLDELQAAYNSLGEAIDIAQGNLDLITNLGEEIKKAKDAAGDGLGPPGDFEIPGGGKVGNDPYGLEDMKALTDQWLQEAENAFNGKSLFGGIGDQVDKVKAKISGFFSWMTGVASDAGDWIASKFSNLFGGSIGSGFSAGWDKAWSFLREDVWGPVEANILPRIDSFVEKISSRLGPFFEQVKGLWDDLVKSIKGAWETYGPPITAYIEFLIGAWLRIFEAMGPVFSDIWNFITRIVGAAIEAIGTILGGIIRIVTGIIEVLRGMASGDWRLMWEGFKDIVFGIFEILKGIVQFALDAVLNMMRVSFRLAWEIPKALWDSIGYPVFMSIWQWIQDSFINKFTSMPGIIGDAFRGLADVAGSAFRSLRSVIAGQINGVIGVINGFLGGVNSVASKLGLTFRVGMIGYLGTSDPGTGPVGNNAMPFAKGGTLPAAVVGSGFVTSGARAIVGEGNPAYPEFVIPTDPKYRSRALALVAQLAQEIGLKKGGLVPQYAIGGVLASGLGRAAEGLWNTAVNTSRSKAAGLGSSFPAQLGRGVLEKLISGTLPKVTKWISDWASGQVVKSLFGAITGSLGMPLAAGGVIPHVYPLMNGALVKGGHGGILAHIGDGRRDELVQPLPKDGSSGDGKTVNNYFSGDLVFPNISSGDDARIFIENLQALG